MSDEITIKKSPKLRAVEDGRYLNSFLWELGFEFLKRWEKDATSTNYWKMGSATTRIRPHNTLVAWRLNDKITARTHKLIKSLVTGGAYNKNTVAVEPNKVVITMHSTLPYANIQNARFGFADRALLKMKSQIQQIKKRAITLTNGAFK